MSLLIESIKLLDGEFYNLRFHEQRMRNSLLAVSGVDQPVQIEWYLRDCIVPRSGLFKCRILYDAQSGEATFSPYRPRNIKAVRVVQGGDIAYPLKYADRSAIERLFDQRDGCDDVMIIRNGKVTDCSYSNVVFRKGRDWYTSDSPLLEGTQRAKLLEENKIQAREIQVRDIRSFDGVRIINAMLEFDSPEIEVSDIVF
ncbi:MAG: aminotransferase class IV [Bacteroidota bacterium]|nr:aminotransferase class IV [Bacteroidota bacterium]